ncbi:hypothetical protein BN946_scf184757.g2 [Trametes cinnabarina]|uniref:Uncharacterized protein n=1 Tax=Pycnoporus cinnabarinus TaxID=5643 RepID=A0A060SKK5_PYCCI|nr:hypothetical protein BN946_scf184757.g2 [Trametes cinnabarina]
MLPRVPSSRLSIPSDATHLKTNTFKINNLRTSPVDTHASITNRTTSSFDYNQVVANMEDWRKRYKTVLDLASAPPEPLPPFYSDSASNATKHTTRSEVKGFDGSPELKYIVYFPAMLESLYEQGKAKLETIPSNWDRTEHVMFATHHVPKVRSSLLPGPTIFSEDDVVSWCDHNILRLALAFVRLAELPPESYKGDDIVSSALSEEIPTLKPGICSAPHDNVNPDRLFIDRVLLQDDAKGQYLPDTLVTIEVKSPNVLTNTPFFDVVRGWPPETQPQKLSHTVRFQHAETTDFSLNVDDRVTLQIWAQMNIANTREKSDPIKVDKKYAILTSHNITLFFMWTKEYPNTLYLSRIYRRTEVMLRTLVSSQLREDGCQRPHYLRPI